MEIVELYVDHRVLDAYVLVHTFILEIESLWHLGPVYTTVEKASGWSRMLGQDMVIWGKWWMCPRRIKGNKIFLFSWASSASWGWTRNSSGEAQLQKVSPRRGSCHFITHEKSSPPLFPSPSVNTHRSRVAFSTNHNWETPFLSWPVDFATVV
jgi:hypothetical protein